MDDARHPTFRLLFGFLLVAPVCLFDPAAGESAPTGPPAEDMVVHRDLDYIAGGDYSNNKDKLDIYMPAGARSVPVLLFFHGGRLQEGDKQEQQFAPRRLVPQGLGVVLANYRLSPAVMHPAHALDAAAAFAWVVRNIDRYGGDPSRVYLGGHSAGGYLVLLLSLDPSYLRPYGLDLSAIRGTLAVSPFTFVEEVARVRNKSVWGEDPDFWMKASVTPHIGSGKPPILFLYAEGDEAWRKRHNEDLARRLREAGNRDAATVEVPNREHISVWKAINEPDDTTAPHLIEFIRNH